MRPIRSAVLLLAVLAAGCTTISPEERRARDEATCRDYGFRPGTDAFAACLQRIDLSRAADRRERDNDLARVRQPVYVPVVVGR